MADPSDNSDDLLAGLDPQVLFSEGFSTQSPLPEIPGFALRSKLGEGGMGTVYRAWQESLQREVALKLVRPELIALEPDATFERLEREAHSMAKLSHPHIVSVYDFIRFDDETVALVLELIEGETLRTLLHRHKESSLPIGESMRLIREIGQALDAAHEAGLVHRDIKPENVLIDLEGHAHVTDFGLAIPIDDASTRLTASGTTVGTLAYLAPEQLDGAPVGVAADQFSFSVLIYEMWTGVCPRGVVEPPHELRRAIHPATSRVLLRAMSRKPEERFPSVAEFVTRLFGAQRKRKGSGRSRRIHSGHAGSRKTLSRRNALLLGGAATGAASLAGLAIGIPAWQEERSWNDLLKTAEVDRPTKGNWIRNSNGSLTSKPGLAVLPLSIGENELGYRYEVRCRVKQEDRVDGFALCFQTPKGFGSVEFNAHGRIRLSGIQKVNGVMLWDKPDSPTVETPLGKSFEFRLRVEDSKLSYFVGKQKIDEITLAPGDNIHLLWPWDWDQPQNGLAIASYDSPTTFLEVKWRAL